MNYLLPNRKTTIKAFLSFVFFVVATITVTAESLAASAYINPSKGRITQKQFLVSVYVESGATEPQIASADIKIIYPGNVTVVSVNDGEFDSYIEKNYDATTRIVTIKAVNNAGNYKQGQVKVASINFESTQNTGQAKLTIDPQQSGITGPSGETLLSETIDSTYTIDVQTDAAATDTTTTTDTTVTAASDVPATGVNENLRYILISAALLLAGGYLAVNQKKTLNK